jgi:hypothetical protein
MTLSSNRVCSLHKVPTCQPSRGEGKEDGAQICSCKTRLREPSKIRRSLLGCSGSESKGAVDKQDQESCAKVSPGDHNCRWGAHLSHSLVDKTRAFMKDMGEMGAGITSEAQIDMETPSSLVNRWRTHQNAHFLHSAHAIIDSCHQSDIPVAVGDQWTDRRAPKSGPNRTW